MSETEVSLRPATPDDAGTLLRLIRALAEYENLLHEVEVREADLHAALFGLPVRAAALLAEVSGRPVGFALWFYTFSTFTGRSGLYLEDLYVEPEFRGRGIGRAVFRELATRAKLEGCARIEWSVLDWNESARGFYEALGAEPMSEWTVHRLHGNLLARLAG